MTAPSALLMGIHSDWATMRTPPNAPSLGVGCEKHIGLRPPPPDACFAFCASGAGRLVRSLSPWSARHSLPGMTAR